MSETNEYQQLMSVFTSAIESGHRNALMLREAANSAMAMHLAMKMVESEMERNTRRFMMEEMVEDAAQFNREIRAMIVEHTAQFESVLNLGHMAERISGVDLSESVQEVTQAMVRLRQVGVEFDYVEQAVASISDMIVQMV